MGADESAASGWRDLLRAEQAPRLLLVCLGVWRLAAGRFVREEPALSDVG